MSNDPRGVLSNKESHNQIDRPPQNKFSIFPSFNKIFILHVSKKQSQSKPSKYLQKYSFFQLDNL